MIKLVEKVNLYLKIKRHMKEMYKMVYFMEKELIHGQMELIIKEII